MSFSKELVNRKFCNFLYYNDQCGEGAKLRCDFFEKLSTYKFIDSPGIVCHNIDIPIAARDENWVEDKLNFIKNYKFTIAFENSLGSGYVNEKLFHPFMAHSIPIYWGDNSVVKEINPDAFINCNDFDNDFDKVIDKIKELDNDDEQYLHMLLQPKIKPESYFNTQDQKLEDFLKNIIARGNLPFCKDPHNIQERCR